MRRRGGGRCRRAKRMYRLLVRLYPAAHRRAFEDEMVLAFGDHYRDVVVAHSGSRVRFWVAVLADTGSSLLTEHAAEIRARRRRRRGSRLSRRRWDRRRPRLSGRRPSGRRRVVVRTRRHQLVYRGRIRVLALPLVLVGAGVATGTAIGHLGWSVLVAGLLVVAWLGYWIRLARRVPAGPRGNGPAPPGGAGVREPRRPLPMSPAGSAARPRPEQEPPGQAAAMI
jgi:hypothetical protein